MKELKLVAGIIALALVFLFVAALLIVTGSASTAKVRPNTLGVNEIYQNPNTYLIAEPVEVTFMRDEKERIYTNVRFQPFNTAAYFDESILFCGSVESFERLPMAITYLTRADMMYRGIACHTFVSAYELETKSRP